MKMTVENISSDIAEQLCRQITADLPEYFGLPECNEHYALGVQSRVNFAVKITGKYVGLLSLDFPYPKNSNLYWMGVLRQYQGHGVGRLLIDEAYRYAKNNASTTMTVETLAPSVSDENYLKTYHFYERQGFIPLFNLKPENYEWDMVYMSKDLGEVTFKKSHHELINLRPLNENDIPTIVSEFAKHNWPKPAATFQNYLTEQTNNTRCVWVAFYQTHFAGYVTLKWDSPYPPFNKQGIPEIMDLNVLPPYQKKGIGSILIDTAEIEATKRTKRIGLGVGLYPGYGNAQKLYIARGYQPDGLGVTYNYEPVEPGKMVCLDDDLVLWFTKELPT